MQFDINSFKHRCQVRSNLRIPEANYAISFLLQPMLSPAITLGCLILIVMPAIKFDDEMLGGAEEIHDVRTDRGLTPEMRAVDRQFLQRSPKDAPMRCRVGSESFACSSAN